jgi:hypothetical protein
MAKSNDVTGGEDIGITANAEAPIDINRYLQKAQYEKSVADMFRVLYRGKLMTETEWAGKANEVLNRRIV